MNGPVRLAVGTALMIAASATALAGCGSPGRTPAGTTLGAQPASVTGCASLAVSAFRRHVRVEGLPRGCRGLGPSGLGQAIRIAVSQLSGSGNKALRRHRAGLVRGRLGDLIAAQHASADRAAAARAAARAAASNHGSGRSAAGPGSQAASGSAGLNIPAGAAALAAWLATAASGTLLLLRELGRARRRAVAGVPGRLPVPIAIHLGLAACGLAVWSAYLLTGWIALPWIAVGILLPVAGLGFSALMLAVEAAASPAAGRGAPVIMIVAHGVLATITVLLALLGAVAAMAAH